jgi:hypothetical protein
MSIGSSGRVVIEVEPELKKALHAALALSGLTLKQWFVVQAEEYLSSARQPSFVFAPRAVEADEHV